MEFDPESDPNGLPSTDSDDWAQRVIQARDSKCLEASLIGLPGGDGEIKDDMETMATRVHSRAANQVPQCLESGLQPEPWVLNTAVAFGSLHKRVCQMMGRLFMLVVAGGQSGVCPFAEDPVATATKALKDGIRAQPLAIESLTKTLSAWQFSQRSGRHEPLVMALTGSTGTGKTETAWVLAEGLLTKRCRISGGTKDIPRGLIVFNGGDYAVNHKVEEYQKQIRRKLGERLEYCGGNVVVLFDELQKATPGTLDALTEAMSEHPRVTYQDGKETISVDSSRVIFLLVSDVGAEGVNAAVLRYRSRSDVVPGTLQAAVKKALDDQWERLRFGKMVDKVIPYLPMDPQSNLLVIELKLQRLGETLPGGLYTTPDLRWHLVQPRYIQYSTYHVKLGFDTGDEVIRHDLAVYGARDTEKEAMQRITGTLREHVLYVSGDCHWRAGAGAEGGDGDGDRASRGRVDQEHDAGSTGRCWQEGFMVDIRYDTSTDEVSFHRCLPSYADGLTELERQQPSAVTGPGCELAWRGVLHDHGPRR